MDSPFASQLGTNYCPTDAELGQIKGLLVEPCMKLKGLDDEISIMRKALDKLTEDRDALGAYVDAHRTLLSPIRRLPLDIIEEIFVACLPTHRNCVMSAQEAPVILGRICSSWRTISLSTPRLWSRLHIVEPTRPYNTPYRSAGELLRVKTAQRLEVANAWLRRSGKCPLSISLESSFDHSITPPLTPSPTPSPDVFLDAVVSFASRWQKISLVIPKLAIPVLLRLTENDVPLLKCLSIVQRSETPHPDAQSSISHARVFRAPTLSRLSLRGCNVRPLELPLQWSNLTALTLLGPTWGAGWVALDIFSRCGQIRTAALLVRESPHGSLQDYTAECPFLHTLDLFCIQSPLHTSGALLSRLSAPNLQDFILRGEEDLDSAISTEFLVSSMAVFTRLASISIDSAAFSSPHLMVFLRGLPPTIRHLHILEPTGRWRTPLGDATLDEDTLFGGLEASPDRLTPLPELEELTVTDCRNVSDETLLRFIVSRMPTLRRINIQFNRPRQVDILPSLQTFVQAGLQASFTYAPSLVPQFSPWEGLLETGPQPLG
ncbi:hypothetical protein K438DRAFT_1888700 [Mycena galopus ATCC 62051]|nr:hypothetical protein K438DRAFT_1888700 [Mycena galopus ATCC 62051]